MRRLSLLSGSAICAWAVLATASAWAQDLRAYDIPPGALRDALNHYATQSDQQIMVAGSLVEGLTSDGLSGRFTPADALARLLAGTGLTGSELQPGVIYIRRIAGARTETDPTVLSEVIITGSLLKQPGQATSPVIVLTRDALDRRAQGTVAEILAELPQNYAGSGTPGALLALSDPAGGNSAIGTSINLRGLGADATLTLVNGRRLAGSGGRGELADVSALPSAAVERVDILLDGASALYGADAVAGVVNVVMRRQYEGMETRVRAGASQGGAEDFMISHLAGRAWTTGSALVAYEYQTRNALNAADRAYTIDGDLRPFGGSDQRALFSAPGNLIAYDATIAAYRSLFAIRPNASGAAQTPADFAPNQANLTSQLTGMDLVPGMERHSVYGRMRQSLGQRIELSGDIRFNQRSVAFIGGPAASIFTVTAANPHFVSPNGSASHTIAYSFHEDLGNNGREVDSRSLGITAGGTLDLGRGWSLDGYVAFAEERGESTTSGRVNSLFLAEALGNRADNPETAYLASRDGYFNPFGGGAANSQAVLDFIGQGYSTTVSRGRAESANLLVEGPLFSLPGGDVQIALGAQVRHESLASNSRAFVSTTAPLDTTVPTWDRQVAALFTEIRIPIVGPENARPGLQSLELTAAGRIEEYEDFGTTTNPKLGLAWSPAADLVVRASYGTSFRAPALPQMFDASVVAVTTLPRADGARVLAIYRYGGNPDLKPETATTWTAGVDYAPPGGVRLSVGYFDTRFSDRISQPLNENTGGALIDPALAPFVQRVDPTNNPADLALIQAYIASPGFAYGDLYPATSYGAILDSRWVNSASVDVRGLDASAAYPLAFGPHAFTLDASASWVLDFDAQTTPAAPEQALVGRVGYPVRLRARAGGSWSMGTLSADAHWNHVAAYEDPRGADIDAWNTVDVRLAWSPTVQWARGVLASISVQNLFDEDPPFYNAISGLGFDPGQAGLLGRTVALQLVKRW